MSHAYWMKQAELCAITASCLRARVGCVIVRQDRIIGCGANRQLDKTPSCTDAASCIIDPQTGGCIRTVHAEQYAIADAMVGSERLDGAVAYVTLSPCVSCYKLLAACGITAIYCKEMYRRLYHLLLDLETVPVIQLTETTPCLQDSTQS